jgi:hypothetical protein
MLIFLGALLASSCSSEKTLNELSSVGQNWGISDSVSVNLPLAQIMLWDYHEGKQLFLGMNGRDYVIFDESGEVLHQIEQKTAGEPGFLGDWVLAISFLAGDELLVQPNMSDQMLIIDFDGNIKEKIPLPFRVMVSSSAVGLKSFQIDENNHLLYAPGRFTGMEMHQDGYKDPLFEIWNRASNTFTPVAKLPEGHPYTKPSVIRSFPNFIYKDGKLVLYTTNVPELHLLEWDGADFQFIQTIKPNFPKFVRYPEKQGGGFDFQAVSGARIFQVDIDGDNLLIGYSEGIEEARYSTMSRDEKEMAQITEPMNKLLSIRLNDLSERYQDLPQEVVPWYSQAGKGRWIGPKNIYLKMEEEDFPTFYFLEKR